MAIPSRQIGWGTEDNLLWQISKQIERLTQVTGTFGGGGGGGVTSITAGTGISVDQATGNVNVSNSGVTSIIAGTGVSIDQSTGDITVSASSGFHMSLSQIVSAGLKYSVALTGTAPSSTGYVSNLMILSPFIPANDLTISNVSIQVNTGVASALAKILVYADVNGRPNGLLIESVDLDCSTLGTKTYNTVYTFEAGKTYWMGTILNSTQVIRSVTLGNLMTIGTSATASTIYTVLTTTVYLYTDPVPANPTLLILSNGPVPMVMLQ